MTTPERLQKAMEYAMTNRPAVGGFPFLAECLRQAGVVRNTWTLPAAQSVYVMDDGCAVVNQGVPLRTGMSEIPAFDENALIQALRTNQANESTFPEFLEASFAAGVIGYDVEFAKRTVTYRGSAGELYTEEYPAAEVGSF